MKLENVTAEIRPRGKWESVDLGVALAQENFRSLMKGWAATVLPLMVIFLGLSYAWYSLESLYFSGPSSWLSNVLYVFAPYILIWWFKPIYERVPLYILSRSLFGETVSITELVHQWPKMIVKNAFQLLFLRRISMNRSFVLPIHELEGLKGKDYKQRVALLSRNGGDGASGLTVACVLVTHIALLSGLFAFLMLFGYGFANEAYSEHIVSFFKAMSGYSMDKHSVFSLMFMLVCYILVLTILTPFYVGGGFAIYVNSRTITEGWDVELAFKRMSDRLISARKGQIKSVLTIFALFSLSVFFTPQAHGAEPDHNNEQAEEVMEDKEFDLNVMKIKQYDGDAPSGRGVDLSPGFASAIWVMLQILGWTAAAAAVGFIIYLIIKNAHVFKFGGGMGNVALDEHTKAKSVLGMDVTPESLPSDIVQAARKAWELGDQQLALSYLYRGSLVWLVNTAHLPIKESDTEEDCLRHTQKLNHYEVQQYFSSLTQTWSALAYGKVSPEESTIARLCDQWPFYAKQADSTPVSLVQKGGV